MEIKLEYTTDGVKTVCVECGEEILSMMHKCNPFVEKKFPY